MPSILKITDGTTTVDFVSSTSAYSVSAWNPAVARRRRNMLGGRGPYEDVDEEMEITVHGTDALAKISSLQELLDQSDRWHRGEPVSPVLLHYKPEASSGELKAVIVGPTDREFIELPRNFPDSPVYDYVDPVVLRFRRVGLWTGSTSAISIGFGIGAVQPVTQTGAANMTVAIETPILFRLDDAPQGDYTTPETTLLVSSADTTANAAKRIVVLNATVFGSSVPYSTVGETDYKAEGNALLRFTTPAGTGFIETPGYTITSSTAAETARRWGVYFNYRNNSTSGAFQVGMSLNYFRSAIYSIPAGTSNPQWAYLGSVSIEDDLWRLHLRIRGDTSSATLDINNIVLQAQDYTTDHAITLGSVSGAFVAYTSISVEPRLLTNPQAIVNRAVDDQSDKRPAAFVGNPFFTFRGGAIAAVWLSKGNVVGTYPTFWRATDTAGTLMAIGFAAIGNKVHLTPE